MSAAICDSWVLLSMLGGASRPAPFAALKLRHHYRDIVCQIKTLSAPLF
jgi:hypothetical protein